MIIDYIPSPTFDLIFKDLNLYLFVMGPVNSGKSTGCIMLAFLRALQQPADAEGVRRWRHLVIRKTTPALKTTTIKSWQEWFRSQLDLTWSYPISGWICLPMADGTRIELEIIFMGIEDEKAADKLRSLEVSSIHINEANEISRDTFELAATRFRRFPRKIDGGPKNPFLICDYNGVSVDHWLYKIAEEEKPEGYSFYKQPPAVLKHVDAEGKVTYTINPDAENIEFIDADYYQGLLNNSEDFISVNLMNNYGEVRRGKPVYKDYDDYSHFVDPEPGVNALEFIPSSASKIIIGMDLGLTPAAAFTQKLWDGTVLVFDEIVTEDCSLEEFVHEHLFPMIAKYKCGSNYKVMLDPAANVRSPMNKKTFVQLLKDLGVNCAAAKVNDPVRRINAVTNYLRKKGKFKLYSTCPYLRKGFITEYKYAESNLISGVVKGDAKPEKNLYSHVHDALQYAMMEYDPGYSSTGTRTFIRFPSRKYSAPSSIGGY